MSGNVSVTEDCGLEVLDLRDYPEFEARSLHLRDVATQMQGMQRIAHAFVESPETILQELVNAAVELCDADSAGISLEIDPEHRSETNYFQWVATAGDYERFLNATLPRVPSACGTCLETRAAATVSGDTAILRPDGCRSADGDGWTAAAVAGGRDARHDLDHVARACRSVR
jgi:hypothetical protein